MRKTRHEGFGNEVKLRILLGTYVLRSGFKDQYYVRAQKIRTLIRRELAGIFSDNDLILMPVFPSQAFSRGEEGMDDYRQRVADVFTCLANLAGLPALAVPVGVENGLPTGVQFMAPAFGEKRLFDVARQLADPFPPVEPRPFWTSELYCEDPRNLRCLHRIGNSYPSEDRIEDVLLLSSPIRGQTEHQCLPGLFGLSGHATPGQYQSH